LSKRTNKSTKIGSTNTPQKCGDHKRVETVGTLNGVFPLPERKGKHSNNPKKKVPKNAAPPWDKKIPEGRRRK